METVWEGGGQVDICFFKMFVTAAGAYKSNWDFLTNPIYPLRNNLIFGGSHNFNPHKSR